MKNLKEALRACPKPDIQVPDFQAQLLQRLKLEQALRDNRRQSWLAPIGFMAMGVLVVCFAILLTLFIVRPDVPRNLNQWVAQKWSTQSPANSYQPIESPRDFWGNLGVAPDMVSGSELNPDAANLLKTVLAADGDKNYAQEWVQQRFPQGAPRVSSVEQEKIVTLRWVRLDNGRKVLVMNEFDAGKLKKNRVESADLNGGIL